MAVDVLKPETIERIRQMKARGLTDEEIDRVITAHPEAGEFGRQYDMSAYLRKGALESTAKTPWGAGANLFAGLAANKSDKQYQERMQNLRDIITGKRRISMKAAGGGAVPSDPTAPPTGGTGDAAQATPLPEQGPLEQTDLPPTGDPQLMSDEELLMDEEGMGLMDEDMLDEEMMSGFGGGGGGY